MPNFALNVTFRDFRPFSAIAENHWPYICGISTLKVLFIVPLTRSDLQNRMLTTGSDKYVYILWLVH